MQSISPSVKFRVAARQSPLSIAQVEEFRSFLPPWIDLEAVYTETYGDLDRKTSLRNLGKTDFFTIYQESKERWIQGCCMMRSWAH